MKYLIIRKSDNVVVNAIVWDEIEEWTPPEGHELIKTEDQNAEIGWIWNGTTFDPDPNIPILDPNDVPPMYPS